MIVHAGNKPLKTEGNKDKDYHLRMARFFAHDGYNDSRHSKWLMKTDLAKKFYRGDQWQNQEDLAIFFQDLSGNPTTRIKMTFNIIRPIIETYRGSALNMEFNGTVYSVGTEAYNRRLMSLRRLKFMDRIARGYGGNFMEAISSKLPIGDTPEETEMNFEDLYIDDYVEIMNNFLENLMVRNEANKYAIKFAEAGAFSGLVVAKPYNKNGHWGFRWVPSQSFFWDRSSIMDDLSDAEYWGEIHPMNPTSIFEQYRIGQEEKKVIEQGANLFADAMTTRGEPFGYQQPSGSTKNRVPVFKVVWTDMKRQTYGYVKTEDNKQALERINYKYEDEDKPRYTEKDLVPKKDLNDRQLKLMKGNNYVDIDCEELRFCDLIPSEYISGGLSEGNGKVVDIVLDYGPYQMEERDPIDPRYVKPPYKASSWSYIDGVVTSPIEDIIDPQRFINRIMSITENRINTAPQDVIAYDKRAASSDSDSEANLLASLSSGRPAAIDSRGLGLPNVLMPMQTRAAESSLGLLNVVGTLSGFVQHTTGMNDAMQGGAAQRDQLVGVTQALIERGSLLQMPFFNMIANVYEGLHNSAVTEGKRIYADNQTVLADMVGESGANVIQITKEMSMENFASAIKRDASSPTLRNAGDQMLMALLQMQVIGKEDYADMLGKSTPDIIAGKLRKLARKEKVMAREQAKRQSMEAEAVMQAQGAQDAQMQEKENQARAHEMAMQDKKSEGKVKEQISKAAAVKALGGKK